MIYETEKELKYLKMKIIILELRQLYLRKLLENDKEETITKLEYIKNKSSNYSLELTKITKKYNDLEIEY